MFLSPSGIIVYNTMSNCSMSAERSLFYIYATVTILCLLGENPSRRHPRLAIRQARRLGNSFRILRKYFSLKVGRLHSTLLILAALCSPAGTTTAFDCEAQTAKLATVSLDAVGGCAPFNSTYGEAETVNVQVLQRSHKMSLPAYSCRLRISREICTCRSNTYWRSLISNTLPPVTPAHPWVGKGLLVLITIARIVSRAIATACQVGIGLLALLNFLAGLFFIYFQRHRMVARAARDATLLLLLSWAPSTVQLYYIWLALITARRALRQRRQGDVLGRQAAL